MNLDDMSIDFDAYLSRAKLFEHVAVHQTGDADCLLIASCRVAPGGTPTVVGETLASSSRSMVVPRAEPSNTAWPK